MGDKLDAALSEALAAADAAAAETRLPVIVTLRPGGAAAELAAAGLEVAHVFESISAVSGQVRAADLARLEALDAVERIEFDGEVQALDP